MGNKEQVLSIKQMKHLQKLGVDTSDASMYWVRAKRIDGKQKNNCIDNDMDEWKLSLHNSLVLPSAWACESVPTYTIGDIIDKLPDDFRFRCEGRNYTFTKNWFSNSIGHEYINPHSDNLIDGLFKLLCWAVDNHKELNKVKN